MLYLEKLMEVPLTADQALRELKLEKPTVEDEGIVIPTEYAQAPFAEAIRNISGAYLGVSTHKNFSFIAASKPEIAFIVNRSSLATNALFAHRIAHLRLSSPESYVDFWGKRVADQIKIVKTWGLSEEESWIMKPILHGYGDRIGVVLHIDKKDSGVKLNKYCWLGKQEDYDRVRNMFLNDKIHIVCADLQNPRIYRLMEQIVEQFGIQFNVFYLSNVEDHLAGKIQGVPAGDIRLFWQNLLSLPMGEQTRILRTVRSFANVTLDGNFHYLTQSVADFVDRRYLSYDEFLNDLASQVTERSPGFTQMPVPVSDRDSFLSKQGWTFPI